MCLRYFIIVQFKGVRSGVNSFHCCWILRHSLPQRPPANYTFNIQADFMQKHQLVRNKCILTLHVSSHYMYPHITCILTLHVSSHYMYPRITCILTLHVSSHYMYPHITCILALHVSSHYMYPRITCILALHLSSLIIFYCNYYLAPGGGCEVLFSPGLSVCLSVCLCVYLCVRPIFWYFISRLLEEISIWNLYRILIWLYSIH